MPPVQVLTAGRRGRCGHALTLAVLLLAALLLTPVVANALMLQPGYKLDAPIEDVSRPTAIAFAEDADEHVFVAERNGRVKVLEGVFDPTPELALSITDEVHSIHDRGLLGMALDPDFPTDPYLYLSYPYDAPLGEEAPVHETGAAGDDSCVPAGGGDPDCLISGRVSRFELDPATGKAVSGEEEPLVEDWCQQFPVHSMGDLKFDAEGALLVSGGDGANFADFDYGQFKEEGSLCDDPENEGGSLRSQDIADGAADPVGYNGTIIRIDPETGEPWPNNPMIGNADVQTKRILAYGLRNPFRLAFRPGASPPELYIADVGSGWFDEINLLVDPINQSSPVANFGWPCFEGKEPNPGFHTLAFEVPLPLCRALYESKPGNLKLPYYPYPRTGEVFPGDQCDSSAGAAISGLIFYEPPAGPEPGAPAELAGSLLFSDAARGCLWQMPEGKSGAPTSVGMRNLAVPEEEEEGAFIPVNIEIGPDGAIYMPNFYANEISRLRHFPLSENQPPEAEIAADRTYGLLDAGEFPVEFDGTGSTDADEVGDLTYEWDLDGDGEFEVGPATISEVYTEKENVTAQLRVVDSEGATDFDRVKLYPGDRPPENLVMEMPPKVPPPWTVGEKIALSGSATDPDEETSDEDEVRLDWDVILRHCPDHCHSHPLEHFADTEEAEVTAPDHEYPSHLLVRLTATDNRGMSIETQRELHPRSVDVRMESEPPGVELSIGEAKREAPFEHTLLAGGAATVSAPETAIIGGHPHAFASWSDGGDRTHLIRRTEDDTLVARYTPFPLPVSAVPLVTPISRVRLRFVTRPGGLPLRVGRRWQRSAFARWLQPGQRTQMTAPKRLRRRGRLFTFSRWTHSLRRVNRVGASHSRTYVAVFNSRPIVRDGLVQALSWRQRAR